MFTKLRKAFASIMQHLRGETFEQVTANSNKQIQKLQVVQENMAQSEKQAIAQAEALRVAAKQADNQARTFKQKTAEAAIVKQRLESIFTVSPVDILEHNSK